MHLPMILRAIGGMLVEIFAELLVDELLDVALDVAVQLALGLPFELRLRQLDGDDRDQTFAHVVAVDRDFVLLLLEHADRIREVVDGAGQRGAEPGKVRAAVDGVDGVGEGENIFGVAVVVLQRDLHFDLVALAFHVDRRIVQHVLAPVQVLHEFGDAAGEAELGCSCRCARPSSVIFRPLFRKAISRRRCASVS